MPGLVGFASNLRRDDDDVLGKMVTAISHKRDSTVHRQRSCLGGFACVHLGLFDHPVGAKTPDGKIGLLLDGWIWGMGTNTTHLERNVAASCLESYLSQGIDFVRQLNGEFNIVLWDQRKGSVWLVNDRYGLRPLQYSCLGDELFFGAEGKAILAGTQLSPKLDQNMVANHLAVGRILLGTRTFFQDIHVLPPASLLCWKNGTVTHSQYWDYVYRPLPSITDDFVDSLVHTFRQAVKRRVNPRYRYAINLSGGLDSRVLASVLASATQGSAVAFTFGIPDSQEILLARDVANRLGMPWKFVPLGPSDFITHAAEGARITEGLDLCVQSHGLVVYPKLSQEADLAFNGIALDVSLGGRWVDSRLFDSNMDSEKVLAIIRKKFSYFDDDLLQELFGSNQIVETAENLLREMWEPNLMQTNWNDFADQFSFRFRTIRVQCMRQKWQRLFLEDAVPSLDNDFVDLLLQIPTHERFNHRIYKRFMERLCPDLMDIPYQRTLLPPSVPFEFWEEGSRLEAQREALYENIWRTTGQHIPYMRYATNYNEWFRMDSGWIKWTDDLLLGTGCRLIELGLNHKIVRKILEEHRNGSRNHRQGLLQLLSLELFLREFF